MSHIMTKEEVDTLLDDNTSRRICGELCEKVDHRLEYIVKFMVGTIGGRLIWYDYEGEFDPSKYRKYIGITGEWTCQDLLQEIPIEWLYTNFEEEFITEEKALKERTEKAKTAAKQAREELKIKKALMKEVITKKLTKEELKFIKFK